MNSAPLIETFLPLVRAAQDLPLDDPAAAEAELSRRLDPLGKQGIALREECIRLARAGRICDRGAPPVRWSRVAGPSAETANLSIDTVWMEGPGPHHAHPAGEIDLCFAASGEPTFDGRAPGWVVFPPGSEHVPTVAGGQMLIVYLLPGGAIEFTRRS